MTEGMIDAWWQSLKPADKAELYERGIDGVNDELGAEPVADLDQVIGGMRNPLRAIVAAAEALAAKHSLPLNLQPLRCSAAELHLMPHQQEQA